MTNWRFSWRSIYSHVWMWELDYKESWAPKSWCFWTVVLEKTLESPLDCKEIQPVHPGGGQSWAFIGTSDAEAETPILWPPDTKSWLIWKDHDAGKDWGQEEKGTTENEMVGWMASPAQWTWVWVNSGNWWWTGRPGVLHFMGSQRVRHNWVTELNWISRKDLRAGIWFGHWRMDEFLTVKRNIRCSMSKFSEIRKHRTCPIHNNSNNSLIVNMH